MLFFKMEEQFKRIKISELQEAEAPSNLHQSEEFVDSDCQAKNWEIKKDEFDGRYATWLNV